MHQGCLPIEGRVDANADGRMDAYPSVIIKLHARPLPVLDTLEMIMNTDNMWVGRASESWHEVAPSCYTFPS